MGKRPPAFLAVGGLPTSMLATGWTVGTSTPLGREQECIG